MSTDRTYTSAEAATITTVSRVVQRDWRRRGFISANSVTKAELSLRDLSRLRLLKELADRSIQLQEAGTFADAFTPNVTEMISGQLQGLPRHRKRLGVVAFAGDKPHVFVCEDFAAVEPELGSNSTAQPVTSVLVLNLGEMADEMAGKIDLVHADRRIEKLDEEMAKRGL